LGAGPAVAKPPQARQDYRRKGRSELEGDKETIERGLSAGLVERCKAAFWFGVLGPIVCCRTEHIVLHLMRFSR
jgi:hypothetical protein